MNLSRILKSLLPSLVPLLVYVAADAFLGETIGLIVGVGVGIVEFVVVLIRDKKPDPFVAADTALLALAGAVSFISKNDIFFKLKPAVIELIFGASFALFLVLPPRYLKSYMERQLRGVEFPDASIPAMRKSLGAMLAVLGVHALLTIWAALRLSTAAWGFISGVLLYILFGAMVLAEFIIGKSRSRKLRSGLGAARGEKVLPIVDEEGRVTGQAPERICHAGALAGLKSAEALVGASSLLHPALRLFIVDAQGTLFLRRHPAPIGGIASGSTSEGISGEARGDGLWDVALTRHVEVGEDLDVAFKNGVRESLGVAPLALEAAHASPQAALRYRRDEDGESELVFVFFLQFDGPFALDEAGGSEGRFFGHEEFASAVREGEMSPRFLREHELLARASAEARRPGA
jgi:intracellular septation protein A/isopentenyldiphosphate isomerase